MDKKILHIIEGIDKNLGGQPAALFGILKLEEKLGIISDVLSIIPPDGTFNRSEFSQTFYLFPSSFPKRFNNSKKSIEWIKLNANTYDLIIFHGIWNFLILESMIVVKKLKRKYLIWPHGSLVPFDLKKKKVIKNIIGNLLIKNLLNSSAGICLTSSKEEKIFERFNAFPNSIILPLPVTIPLAIKGSERNETNTFTFVFIGRINYKKGIDKAIEAIQKIIIEFPFVRLDIWGTGDPEYTELIRKIISTKKLSSCVKLRGFLDNAFKNEIYCQSSCFILPSMYENFGIAPIEALQGGLPVLISDNVFIWEDIKEAAWICKYDTESVAKLMKEIVSDRNTYLCKREIARSIGSLFLPDNLLSSYHQEYLKIFNL